jgi:hypothetical protein
MNAGRFLESRRSTHRRRAVAALAAAWTAASIILLAARAHADEPWLTADAAARCVCLERAMQGASDKLSPVRTQYESARKRLADLEAMIALRRAAVERGDEGQAEPLRRMLVDRDALKAALRDQLTEAYANEVERYNQRVTAYNHACGKRRLDPKLLESARKSAVCPAE